MSAQKDKQRRGIPGEPFLPYELLNEFMRQRINARAKGLPQPDNYPQPTEDDRSKEGHQGKSMRNR